MPHEHSGRGVSLTERTRTVPGYGVSADLRQPMASSPDFQNLFVYSFIRMVSEYNLPGLQLVVILLPQPPLTWDYRLFPSVALLNLPLL